jgi:drug/metabolite transporter (DMT)-like permease
MAVGRISLPPVSVAAPDAPPIEDAPALHRSPRFGYLLAAVAASMWALNGSFARLLIDDGVSPFHLSEMRSALSFVLLAGWLAIARRDQLRVRRDELPALAWLGIGGLAFVHATYFLAIERLDVGVALTIQYLGPLLILLWLRIFHRRRMAPSLWGAVALSAVGSFLVVRAYDTDSLDGIGLLFAFAAAVTFGIYMVAAERAGRGHTPATTLAYGFGFATLFWLVVRPPWTFPFDAFAEPRNLALGVLGVALVGTLVPFILIVTAVRHIPAPRAAVVATLEPVLAAIIAWPVLDQALSPPQIAGVVVVVCAVVWVQSHQPQLDLERAP